MKAVTHGKATPSYQARYLADAVKAFAGRAIRLGIRAGNSSTLITAAEPHHSGAELTYVVSPMRLPTS